MKNLVSFALGLLILVSFASAASKEVEDYIDSCERLPERIERTKKHLKELQKTEDELYLKVQKSGGEDTYLLCKTVEERAQLQDRIREMERAWDRYPRMKRLLLRSEETLRWAKELHKEGEYLEREYRSFRRRRPEH